MALSSEAFRLAEVHGAPVEAELDLIQQLEAHAAAGNMTGVDLAREIGINHALWSRVRRHHERFGADTCAKIVERYPELRAAAARYLTDSFRRPTLELLAEAGRVARLIDRPLPIEREAS